MRDHTDLLAAAATANMVSIVRNAARYQWLRDPRNEKIAVELVRCCEGKQLDSEIDQTMADQSALLARRSA